MILPQAVVHSAQGQDRSNFQQVTPWTGNDFGFSKATEGTTFADATFAANWRNLKTAGIPRGAYHFWHPALDPVIQARFFVDTVMKQGLMPGDMLVADIEITAGGPMARLRRALGRERLLPPQNLPADVAGLTASSVDIKAKAFLDEVSALAGPHNPVLVYTNLSVGSLLRSCTGYELWIAFPSSAAPASVAPWKTWRFWQWGIVSGTDRDAYNGTKADLDAWVATFKSSPPAWREWLTEGHSSLQDVSKATGMEASSILRATVQHYDRFDPAISAYVNGLAAGTVKPSDKIGPGGRLWVRG